MKRIKPIYEYFKECSKEEIDFIITTLSPKAKYILKLKYGDNFNNPHGHELSEDDKKYFQGYILKTIRKRLEDLANGKQLVEKPSNIYEYFPDYTFKLIDEAIKLLPKGYLDIIYKKYGDNLKEVKRPIKLNSKDYLFFRNSVLLQIEKNLKIICNQVEVKKIKTIYEYFPDYTEEEIDNALENLSDKAKKTLVLKYGIDYKNPINKELLTSKEKRYFCCDILPAIRKRLLKNRKVKENLTKEDYKKLICVLKQFILKNLLSVFTYEESIIIILKLMLNYDTKVISNLLNVKEEKILEVTKRFLIFYKDKKINEFILMTKDVRI